MEKINIVLVVTMCIILISFLFKNWAEDIAMDFNSASAVEAFSNDDEFEIISDGIYNQLQIITFYDKKTKVKYMYARYIYDGAKSGGPAAMYDKNGNILLYEGN